MEGEEAQEHHYANDKVEDHVEKVQGLLIRLDSRVLIREIHHAQVVTIMTYCLEDVSLKALDNLIDELMVIRVINTDQQIIVHELVHISVDDLEEKWDL